MSGFSIRPALESDAVAATEVIRAAYAPWMARLDDLPDITAGVVEEIGTARVWVAADDTGILGYLSAGFAEDHVHIANIAVHPDAAGQGIATALIAHVTDAARSAGVAVMWLATHRAMSRNVRFYERRGWAVSGREGSKVMMEYHLGR